MPGPDKYRRLYAIIGDAPHERGDPPLRVGTISVVLSMIEDMFLGADLSGVTAQNERLAATLREARDQIVALKEEVDRLAQPRPASASF